MGESMNDVTFSNLNQYTVAIKEREGAVVSNFYEIGCLLKEVRDSKFYKETHSEFGNYLSHSGFQFSERHAYNMIAIATEFSATHCTKLGISKCLQILELPLSSKEVIKEELARPNPDLASVENTIQAQQELKLELAKDIDAPLLHVPESVQEMSVSDKVDMLDKALSYLDEELDNVFSGLSNLNPTAFKGEYKSNKQYYSTTFQNIENKLTSVSTKLRKAKSLLDKMKKMRR